MKKQHYGSSLLEKKLNHTQQLLTMTDVKKNKIANSAYHQQILPQLTTYLHECVDSIPLTTSMNSIAKEWLRSWPVLTTIAVIKNLLKYPMAIMGHMHRIRKGIRPLKKCTTEQIMNGEMEQEPPL